MAGQSKPNSPLTYRGAGVDIDAGSELVKAIAPLARRTARPEVLAGLGGFGSLFEIPANHYRQPVLVSGTDGVGTKLQLAQQCGRHLSIGVDLVAMCVNDVIVCGAEPLFFLDYFACGKLDPTVAKDVIAGIADGCLQAGAALVGGETAEMPGMYAPADYDLAGFCVGIVEKDAIIDGATITPAQTVIGLRANGVHSNGYSLVRRVLERAGIDAAHPQPEHQAVVDALLTPTQIYVKAVRAIIALHRVHGLAHITGGGMEENLARVLPNDCDALIDRNAWPRPWIFDWIQDAGNIDDGELLRTFNCGVGMTLIADSADADEIVAGLAGLGIGADKIGEIAPGSGQVRIA